MAWERRRGHAYYYRVVRRGRKVVKTYCGSGEIGRLAAEQDERVRQQVKEQRVEAACRRQTLEELAALLIELGDWVDQMLACNLIAAGWTTHSRQWRAPNGRNCGRTKKS